MSLFGFIVDLLQPVKPGDYFRLQDEKKRETPEEFQARVENSGWYCRIHKWYFQGMSKECPYCAREVEQEKETGLFLPGINEKNCKYYLPWHWEKFHLIENERKAGKISDTEARRQWREIVDNEINAKVKSEEESAQKSKEDKAQAEAQKRREYEEARKVYGIWTPH